MTQKELFKKYPYIYAWGKFMASFDFYIEVQCNKALEEKAPENVIFYSSREEKWVTFEDLSNERQAEVEQFKYK